MSVGRLGKTTNWPDDVRGQQVLDERHALWGEMSGKVVDIDYKTQTMTVQPQYKAKINGKPTEAPQLKKVPFHVDRAGGGGITYPIAKDDFVSLRPQIRSTEKWHTEEDFTATDARSFSLSDMEAYVQGGNSLKTPLKKYDEENVHIRADDEGEYGLRINKAGKFKFDGNQGDIYAILVKLLELLSKDKLTIKYGSSSGSGHELFYKLQYKDLYDKAKAMAIEPPAEEV